VEILKIYRSMF